MEGKEKELVMCFELQAPHHIINETVQDILAMPNAKESLMRWKKALDDSYMNWSKIVNLPFEDTVWNLHIIQSKCMNNSLEETLRIMALLERGPRSIITVQVNIVNAEEVSYEEQAIKFICFGCLHPIGKTPRRPKILSFKDTDLTEKLVKHCEQMGIASNIERSVQDTLLSHRGSTLDPDDVRQCATCSSLGNSDCFKPCPRCEGVIYCCDKCLTQDWEKSHKLWCAVFKRSMDMENTLADLPFSFVNVTTSRTFCRNRKKNFLQQCGVFGLGLWQREFPDTTTKFNAKRIVLEDRDTIYGLPMETSLLNQTLPEIHQPLTNWLDYYALRGFPDTSVICVLLNFALTLYYIITICLPSDFKDVFLSVQQAKLIVIHIIGAEIEADMYQPFVECARLLRPLHLQIHLFGNEIPELYAEMPKVDENLYFQIHCGLYHEIDHSQIPEPHVVVCFNGGLGAYPSFMPTVKHLIQKKVPLFYTDYGLASISFSSSALEKCKAGIVSEPKLNPFRSPFRITSTDQNLPRYTNAFISYIKPYSDLPTVMKNSGLS